MEASVKQRLLIETIIWSGLFFTLPRFKQDYVLTLFLLPNVGVLYGGSRPQLLSSMIYVVRGLTWEKSINTSHSMQSKCISLQLIEQMFCP